MNAAAASIAQFAVHGGRVALARAVFPGAHAWLDLSTGIAPWPYPVNVSGSLERLPEPAALAELEAAAAAAFGAPPAAVVAVPGSDLALRLLGVLLPGRVAVVRPGYSGHALMWAERTPMPIRAADIALANDFDVVVLARPNNPDGTTVDRDVLAAAAAALHARGGHLIVDEAFVDATPGDSLGGSRWPGMIVLRSFGKFFGLAGLRLGFVIAGEAIVAGLRRMLGDWPVSGPAIAAGTAAYLDHDWQAAQRARLAGAATRLDGLLGIADLRVTGGTSCFRLIEAPARDALFTHFAQAAILTRPFADAPQRLRLGLPGDDAAWHRLADALDNWRHR